MNKLEPIDVIFDNHDHNYLLELIVEQRDAINTLNKEVKELNNYIRKIDDRTVNSIVYGGASHELGIYNKEFTSDDAYLMWIYHNKNWAIKDNTFRAGIQFGLIKNRSKIVKLERENERLKDKYEYLEVENKVLKSKIELAKPIISSINSLWDGDEGEDEYEEA